MYSINLNNSIERIYSNNGQHAEMVFRYSVTGVISGADNIPHYISADCLNIQIKSARATICKGDDVRLGLADDVAELYAYVVKDFSVAYIMDKDEYIEFAETFGAITRDSNANGGKMKMRFNKESKALIAWLENH